MPSMKTNSKTTPLLLNFSLAVFLMTAIGCSGSKKTAMIENPTPRVFAQEPVPEERVFKPEVKPDNKPTALMLANVYFEFDNYDLRPETRKVLTQHARALKERMDVTVLIEGHCDERGSIEYNLALGDKRARAVKEYLVSLGIQSARLTIISYGKERPLDYGHNESAWSQNRRAQFVIKAMMGTFDKT